MPIPFTAARRRRGALLFAVSLAALGQAGTAVAQTAAAPEAAGADNAAQQGAAPATAQQGNDDTGVVVVTAARTTRSAVTIDGAEMQKVLPGVNPVKAIQTLPGVQFETADP